MIAHRLITVKNADKIAVVENGLVVESGTHMELLDRKGPYFRYHFLNALYGYNFV